MKLFSVLCILWSQLMIASPLISKQPRSDECGQRQRFVKIKCESKLMFRYQTDKGQCLGEDDVTYGHIGNILLCARIVPMCIPEYEIKPPVAKTHTPTTETPGATPADGGTE